MLPDWRTVALKQKAVYRILNMWNYDLTRKCLIAEAWCPLSKCEATQAALAQLQEVARQGGNVFEELMETVKVASLGQITDALFNVGGQYRRNM